MAHAENSVVINAPVEKVFAFVLDGGQNPKWRSAVMDIKLVQGELGKIGATYKQGLKGPTGKRMDGDYRITDYVPNQTFAFQVVAGPANPSGRYSFEPADGGTKVTFVLDLVTRGLQKLIDPMITATMRREVASLDVLKAYLESH